MQFDSSKRTIFEFLAWLVVPAIFLSLALHLLGPRAEELLYLISIPYLAVLSVCGLFAILRFRHRLKRLPTSKLRMALFSILYGQVSFDILLFFMSGGNIWLVVMIVLTVVIMFLVVLRPSFSLLLAYAVFCFVLTAGAVTNFYFHFHFSPSPVQFATIIVFIAVPCFWLTSAGIIAAMIATKDLRAHNIKSSLRYSLGVALVTTIFVYAILYMNIAELTRGRVFEYKKEAVALQQELRLANAFQGLPSRVYRDIIEQPENSKKTSMVGTKIHLELDGREFDEPLEGRDIGLAWADFYQSIFERRGLNMYRIVKCARQTDTKGAVVYRLLLYASKAGKMEQGNGDWSSYFGIEPYEEAHAKPKMQYLVILPKGMKYNNDLAAIPEVEPPKGSNEIDIIEPNTDLYLRVQVKNNGQIVPEIYGDYLLRINSLETYLQYAQNYLDNAASVVRRLTKADYLNSYMDYLYFSVATVFTTGNSDVTAIGPQVRDLNMSEIGLGWALLFIFGGLVVEGINKGDAALDSSLPTRLEESIQRAERTLDHLVKQKAELYRKRKKG